MVANADKCHLLKSTSEEVSIKIENEIIKNSLQEKLLGIVIDSRLTFEPRVKNLCKKAGQKLHDLARNANYMDISKKRSIMNAFILSQFSYCPLIQMFHSRKLNHRINKIHEHALRIVYNDHQCTFEELLERDNTFTIHERNFKKLAIEMFKVNNKLSVQLVSENFHFADNHYNFRHHSGTKFKVDHVETKTYGKQTISYLGHKIWNSIPQEIKSVTTLAALKTKMRHWKPICSCRICRIYIQRVGFVYNHSQNI